MYKGVAIEWSIFHYCITRLAVKTMYKSLALHAPLTESLSTEVLNKYGLLRKCQCSSVTFRTIQLYSTEQNTKVQSYAYSGHVIVN